MQEVRDHELRHRTETQTKDGFAGSNNNRTEIDFLIDLTAFSTEERCDWNGLHCLRRDGRKEELRENRKLIDEVRPV
jgi:hypothetical protein